jgi:group I intron endonuclease
MGTIGKENRERPKNVSKIENCGIYQIRNLITNDLYIGQSNHLHVRETSHFWELKRGTHHSIHLQNAFNKYGKENFVFEILLICESFELTYYEQKLVNTLNPSYNICKECINSIKGIKLPEDTKLKIGNANRGRHLSEEARLKMSVAAKNRAPMSQKTKEKVIFALKNRIRKEETFKKISVARLGHKVSKETRIKISDTLKKRNSIIRETRNLG